MRHHNTDPNTKNNVLWVGEDKVKVYIFLSSNFSSIFLQVLYEKVEDGKLVNFDPSALAPLISQYLTEPKPRFRPKLNYIGTTVIIVYGQGKFDTIPWRCGPGIPTSGHLPEEIPPGHPQASVYQQVSACYHICCLILHFGDTRLVIRTDNTLNKH